MANEIAIYQSIIDDVKNIIESGRQSAYFSVNSIMISTYWNIGRRIVEEEQQGQGQAQYGKKLIKVLSQQLLEEYGSGFSERYLAYFRKFYLTIPNLEILQTRLQNLSWSHMLTTLRVDDEHARRWYLENASNQGWTVKQLSRNISTQYSERHFVEPTTKAIAPPDKFEILKNPFMAEFLGFKPEQSFSETELEASIIGHLQEFLLEMGKGFAFVARQQHIRTDADDYYIDLVFYNVVLKCYVLIDFLSAGRGLSGSRIRKTLSRCLAHCSVCVTFSHLSTISRGTN